MELAGLNDFLTMDDVEAICSLTPYPESFECADYADLDFANRFKYPYANGGSVTAIAPELLLEIMEATLDSLPEPVRTSSPVFPWCPRGQSQVPLVQNYGSILIDTQVPQGYQAWISGYALNLFPSTANELNYRWQILINGVDLLNKGNSTQIPGRPVQSPDPVIIAHSRAEMFLAQAGSRIQVLVQALDTLAASDSISATVLAQLEGMP